MRIFSFIKIIKTTLFYVSFTLISCSQEEVPIITFRGQVLDHAFGNPITGAQVKLDGTELSTNESYFGLELETGSYFLSIIHSDFSPFENTITIQPAQDTIEYRLIPKSNTNLIITLTDHLENVPISEAKIEIINTESGDINYLQTDLNGEVEIFYMLQGQYIISASKDGYSGYNASKLLDINESEMSLSLSLSSANVVDVNQNTLTLTEAKSPYYVLDDWIIDEEKNITIEPCVEIHFQRALQLKGGVISINGTKECPIKLRGIQEYDENSLFGSQTWSGIEVHSLIDGKISFENIIIENARIAIEIYPKTGKISLNNFELFACTGAISSRVKGIDLEDLTINLSNGSILKQTGYSSIDIRATVNIDNLFFSETKEQYGTDIVANSLNINNSTFYKTSRIRFNQGEIKNTIFDNKSSGGIEYVMGSKDETVRIEKCNFTNNRFAAVFITQASYSTTGGNKSVLLKNNYIYNNNGLNGIDLETEPENSKQNSLKSSYDALSVSIVDPVNIANKEIGSTWKGF